MFIPPNGVSAGIEHDCRTDAHARQNEKCESAAGYPACEAGYDVSIYGARCWIGHRREGVAAGGEDQDSGELCAAPARPFNFREGRGSNCIPTLRRLPSSWPIGAVQLAQFSGR